MSRHVKSVWGLFSLLLLPRRRLLNASTQCPPRSTRKSANPYCHMHRKLPTHHSAGSHSPATKRSGVGLSKQPSFSSSGGEVNVTVDLVELRRRGPNPRLRATKTIPCVGGTSASWRTSKRACRVAPRTPRCTAPGVCGEARRNMAGGDAATPPVIRSGEAVSFGWP